MFFASDNSGPVPPQVLYSRMADGLVAIRREWHAAEGRLRECVDYVLDARAGSWQRTFRNARLVAYLGLAACRLRL